MIRKTAVTPALVVCLAMSLYAAESDGQNPPGASSPAVSASPAPAANAQPASATNAQTAPAASAPPAAPKKQAPGNWWEKSSLERSPLPPQWLFHAEGTLSYMNASGNASGSTFDTVARADLRKDRWTSHSFIQWSRRDMTYGFGQGTVNYTERTLREQVDGDITRTFKLVAGVEDYQNTMIFMDKRLNVYAGVGAIVFRNDKQQFTATGGVGYAEFAFDRAHIMALPFPVGPIRYTPSSGGALGMQTWRWKVSPRFSFSEDASYMKYFDPYLGYRWTINMNGNFPIDKHFSFNLTYRVKEETNSIVTALHVFAQDRAFLVGIRGSI